MYVALIEPVPGPTAVTTPWASTVATFVFPDANVRYDERLTSRTVASKKVASIIKGNCSPWLERTSPLNVEDSEAGKSERSISTKTGSEVALCPDVVFPSAVSISWPHDMSKGMARESCAGTVAATLLRPTGSSPITAT